MEQQTDTTIEVPAQPSSRAIGLEKRNIDRWLLFGLLLGAFAVVSGIAASGAGLRYFFQTSSLLIVVGGTLGVTLITAPKDTVRQSLRRIRDLASNQRPDREVLIEEIVSLARTARKGGLIAIEPLIPRIANTHLRNGLVAALDARDAAELQSVLENEIRLSERHGQSDANMLETAAGYAPTIGILGTVVGLIEMLRSFSDIRSIGVGAGAAFVSTIYGLLIANFALLPLAHRILARLAESCETQEMIAEGVVSIFSNVHPSIVRQRLAPYLRDADVRSRVLANRKVEVLTHHAHVS